MKLELAIERANNEPEKDFYDRKHYYYFSNSQLGKMIKEGRMETKERERLDFSTNQWIPFPVYKWRG